MTHLRRMTIPKMASEEVAEETGTLFLFRLVVALVTVLK